MCEFNTKITIVRLLRLTIVFTLLDEVIYHQVILSFGNRSCFIIASFGAHLLKHASSRPVFFQTYTLTCTLLHSYNPVT